MSFISLISNLFKRSKNRNLDLSKRWLHYSNGLIIDSDNDGQIAWLVGSFWFEKWFLGLEERLQLTLGRRLVQASSESAEFLLLSNKNLAPKGKDIDMWQSLIFDWHQRGLGTFSYYDEKDEEVNLLINNYSNLHITVGFLSAAWESLRHQRHKCQWSDSESNIMLTLKPISDSFPNPTNVNNYIPDLSNYFPIDSSEWWDALNINSEGSWSLLNSRKMIISDDLIIRFSQCSKPFVKEVNFSRLNDYTWDSVDSIDSIWWSASADSAREIFISESSHIMIRDIEDWKQVGTKHLHKYGLGKIEDVKPFGGNDGIQISLQSLFHPSITCGILLACWERAYGRNGKIIFSIENNNFFVKISPALDIAEADSQS